MPFQIDKHSYRLLDGQTVDLRSLDEAEALYLRWLDTRAASGEGYDELLPAVLGPGGYLMGPSAQERRRGSVYRAAMDLLERVAQREGMSLPRKVKSGLPAGFHSVTDVATELAISRAAVVKAIQQGRLAAYRMG